MDMSAYNSYEQLRATEFRLGKASRDAEVAALQELKQAWHDKFWEQSKETNQLRQQLTDADKRIKELEHKLVLREAQWKRKEKGE